MHRYNTTRFCSSGGFLHDEFDSDSELTLEQIDEISYERALESVGRTPPVSFSVDGVEIWSYDNNRGIDLDAKYADFHKRFQTAIEEAQELKQYGK